MFRHIRSKMIAAFAVPLALLVAGAGLGALSSAQRVKSIDQQTPLSSGAAASVPVVHALESERAYAVLALLSAAGPGSVPPPLRSLAPQAVGLSQSVAQVEAATNQAVTGFQTAVAGADHETSAPFDNAVAALASIPAARPSWAKVAAGGGSGLGGRGGLEVRVEKTYGAYTLAISAVIDGDQSAASALADTTLRSGVGAVATSLSYTESQAQVVEDLVAAELSSGADQVNGLNQTREDLGAEQLWGQQLSTGPASLYPSIYSVSSQSRFRAFAEAAVAEAGAAQPTYIASLVSASTPPLGGSLGADAQVVSALDQRAASLHRTASIEALLELALDGAGILAGLLLVLLVSRSVTRPLVDLVRQAEQLASTVLPQTVKAILLHAGTSSESAPKVPTVKVESTDEVADMAQALDALNKTAVELATGQAELRHNLAEAFVNLGRRNQNLVTRQLEYLSEIELKEADPDSLDELFRLDHLATRMRRNAESLLILAGSGPARQWSQAVPAMDVARAASAEVEDYKRLRLHHFDAALVIGAVTTDLVHILAELIENALTFSPPTSTVDIYGRFLEGSYVVVIVDSGVGMPAEELEIANRRLAGEEEDSKVPGRYLGHFVAGRLAARHGIGITLQASHSGGIVARVKLPVELMEEPVPDLSAQAELPPAPSRPATNDSNTSAARAILPPPSGPLLPPGAPAAPFGGLSPQPAPVGPFEPPAPRPDPNARAKGAHFLAAEGLEPLSADAGQALPATDEGAPGPFSPALRQALSAEGLEPPPTATADSSHLAAPEPPATAASHVPEVPYVPGVQGVPGVPEVPEVRDVPEGRGGLGEDPRPAPTSKWDPLAVQPTSPPGGAAETPSPTAGAISLIPATAPEPVPDLSIFSPLAATNAVSTGSSWDIFRAPQPAPAPIPPDATPPVGRRQGSDNAGPFVSLGAGPSDTGAGPRSPAPPPTTTSASGSLLGSAPTVGPATQARTTADGLRKLTRRVPGAALEQEDSSLLRATPTTTPRNPLGVASALSQYLSATANEGQTAKPEMFETPHGAEKEQGAR